MPAIPTQGLWLSCAQCEEFHPAADFRWFRVDDMHVTDAEGQTVRMPPYETTNKDSEARPYCGRCAELLKAR